MRTFPSVRHLSFAFPDLPQIGCVFGTRMGGGSAAPFDRANISLEVGDRPERVLANRKSMQLGLGFVHWQELRQVHGDEMIFDPDPADIRDMPALEGDGLATSIPGQALVIKTADCQPVLLAHRSGAFVAALHIGWRGNVAGFPTSGVRRFCAHYGLDPADVFAVRGPSLGPGASQFVNFEQEFGEEFRDYYNPQSQKMNLWQLTRDQLLAAGISARNIFSLDMCTCALTDFFFSYRRERPTGRQASLIWIKWKP
ncbi:hypothetical protein PCS_00297 [Desulfocurvibacter africanus PCS]|uniref:Purine nucleoside phosphorylase n=1 Tax=Desulfocurvibacter africanus PCS TaxID=1262666 RepID=M5PWH9_DESAF|nr:polyphenol oxidase family protein [Desulfocurvibacter africanus]EMG38667.1 hypothetical protein PCS_00297 [Desulfocurvibacter africanus PCS]